MKQALIFFDIDGTLITEDNKRILPDSTKKAISLARENGHLAFVNTGRVFLNLDNFIKDIGFDGYICGCGTYIRCHDQILFHHQLADTLCKEIGLLARECRIYSIFEAAGHNAIDFSLNQHQAVKALHDRFQQAGHPITMNVGDPDFSFDKFTIWYDELSDLPRFKKGLSDSFTYIHRGEGFGEIIPKGISKATGIAFLQDFFQIPLEQCYAFGDGPNDLPMLQYVPNSIGMGNGNKNVLKQVSYITKDILEDGIWHGLRHFQLI